MTKSRTGHAEVCQGCCSDAVSPTELHLESISTILLFYGSLERDRVSSELNVGNAPNKSQKKRGCVHEPTCLALPQAAVPAPTLGSKVNKRVFVYP